MWSQDGAPVPSARPARRLCTRTPAIQGRRTPRPGSESRLRAGTFSALRLAPRSHRHHHIKTPLKHGWNPSGAVPPGAPRPVERIGSRQMRFTSPRDELATKLALAARAASSKSTIPVLGQVRLGAEQGTIELAATDMELSLRVPLEASVEEGGAVVLPRLAADIVR